MADVESPLVVYRTGETLMWRVRANWRGDAGAAALQMGWVADKQRLGRWGVAEIGLGDAYWFDLTLTQDVDAVMVRLAFDRQPDFVY